jgi:hypothetical protein
MDHPAVVRLLIPVVSGAMWMAAEVLKPLALAVLLSFALAARMQFIPYVGVAMTATMRG